ncbi:MAG: toprim domain-containing protein [Methylococcaceae bacterium]|nr:toprim domain-containing protein [Methylococcaceae bacterium]
MVDFWTDTHGEIKRRLLDESSKARVVGEKINGIICPDCGKPEAYAHANEPNVIICHRMSQCGAKTLTRELYPDLFNTFEERFKPTPTNPRATAEAFLQARGLDTASLNFSQGSVFEKGKTYPTVKIPFAGISFERLIDYQGSNKTRLSTYKGKHYETKAVQEAKQVYVVEGIFDALALAQVGLPAIATLSSTHNPESCFKKEVRYILGFDNDSAGIKAVKKFKTYLNERGINFSVQLPPIGKDWNDLLISGALGADKQASTLALCEWRGALAMAKNALDYFEIFSKQKPYNNAFFEFNQQTYKGTFKAGENEGDQPTEHKVMRMLDCVLNIAYSIEDASLQYESRLSHIINAVSSREGINTLRFKGADFSALNDFKSKLLQYRLLFFGSGSDLTYFAEYLFQKKPIKVRECQSLGYDPLSGCYVLNKFLYDKDGKHYAIDKDGYFHNHKLKPFSGQDKSITRIDMVDVAKFIQALHGAYGDKGLLALGFWVSTTFSHVIFKEFGFFPFMSFHGDPHCGKSDLTTTLNRCFFIDSEGLAMSSGNTKKGELRTISQKSSMVTAMLEGRKNSVRFDYDSILPLYNRNSLQVRAQTTNDNQVHDLKFTGALAFVQNVEQFISKPAKERVVSIHFTHDGLDDTYDAWQHLKTYSPEQLAGIGHFILRNRTYFEKEINKEINETANYLRAQGVGIDRIAKNHAVAYAGASLLMELTKPAIKDNFINFTLQAAMSKIETARSELLLADHFMEFIESFSNKQGVYHDDFFLIVHMPTAITSTNEAWNKSELLEQLKLVDGFTEVKSSRVFGSQKKCWHFKRENRGNKGNTTLHAA